MTCSPADPRLLVTGCCSRLSTYSVGPLGLAGFALTVSAPPPLPLRWISWATRASGWSFCRRLRIRYSELRAQQGKRHPASHSVRGFVTARLASGLQVCRQAMATCTVSTYLATTAGSERSWLSHTASMPALCHTDAPHHPSCAHRLPRHLPSASFNAGLSLCRPSLCPSSMLACSPNRWSRLSCRSHSSTAAPCNWCASVDGGSLLCSAGAGLPCGDV